jgi:hypothetical protein
VGDFHSTGDSYLPLPVAWPAVAASLTEIVESMKPRLPNQTVERTAAVAGRFDAKTSAEANLAKSVGEEKAAAVSLASPIGERFRFSNRHGMHNDLSFLRGKYHITVECAVAHGWDEVKHLARAIDDRLLSQHKEK